MTSVSPSKTQLSDCSTHRIQLARSVLMPHSSCNCRCLMWNLGEPMKRELVANIERQMGSLPPCTCTHRAVGGER